MSFNNNPLGQGPERPNRVSDPASRPEPRRPDLGPSQPWFVSSEEQDKKKSTYSSKSIIKRVVSIVFPFAAIAAMTAIVAFLIVYAVGMYE